MCLKYAALGNDKTIDSHRQITKKKDLEPYQRAWSYPRSIRSMLNWYRAAVLFPPKLPKNKKILNPVKIFWGERDPFLKTEMGRNSLRFLENGEYQGSTATHWLHHDIPEILNPAIYEFLQR
ncbi:alpha/beta fold hydrolase [Leptospira tipperaryensis]|uniref:alpha/beta fold hydrolase n=1 Tax=Leptospira tipperaryensis TaxID=2564040 RepID=UPI0012EAB830|nr:alpha/beta hydrolase [Leptospira tipperaryensis]